MEVAAKGLVSGNDSLPYKQRKTFSEDPEPVFPLNVIGQSRIICFLPEGGEKMSPWRRGE